jgi:hypothetical protein
VNEVMNLRVPSNAAQLVVSRVVLSSVELVSVGDLSDGELQRDLDVDGR